MAVNLELKISNLWFYTLLISLVVIVSLGGVVAYNSNFNQGTPSEMGHSSGEIDVDIGGTVKTLQQAINDGDIGGTSGLGSCINKRTAARSGDHIGWCPTSHKKVIYCGNADNEGGANSPTTMTTCTSDGACDANTGVRNRNALDDDASYLELVENPNTNQQGCWSYDSGGNRNSYRIEMICCQ